MVNQTTMVVESVPYGPFKQLGRFRPRIVLVCAILSAFTISGSLCLVASPAVDRFYTPDSPEYVNLARNLSAYWNPTDPLWGSATNRTPGYPLLIAAAFAFVGEDVVNVIGIQVLLFLGSIYLTYRIGKRLSGPLCGSVAACVLALNLESNVYAIYVMNETLFTTVLLASTWAWLIALDEPHKAWAFLAGSGIGIASLIRPAGMYLPVLLAPLFLFGSCGVAGRFLKVALFLIGVAFPVGGWMAHHYSLTGTAFVTTVQSKDMLYFRAAGAMAEEQNVHRWVAATVLAERLWEPYGIRVNVAERQQLTRAIKHSNITWINQCFDRHISSERTAEVNSYRLAREEKRLAIRTLWQHPAGTFKIAAKGLVRLFGGTATHRTLRLAGLDTQSGNHHWIRTGYIAVALGLLGFCYLGATAGLFSLLRHRRYRVCYTLLVFVAYFTAVALGPTATTRYRIPMMPFVAILTATGILAVYQHMARRRELLQNA